MNGVLDRRPGHLRLVAWLASLLLLASASACGPAGDALAPPEIRYGEDVCAECGMIISEPRFAAGLVAEVDGQTQTAAFDDIGDMLMFAAGHPSWVIRRWYVHDYHSGDWLPAESATFVQSTDIRTPMGHGLAAFADPAQAEELAKTTGGTTVSFDELVRQHGAPTPQ
jgi:copper chaperone NosL